MSKTAAYDADSIELLSGREHVRLRPGMYVSDVEEDGIFHLLKEVLDNGLDEFLAKYANKIEVTIEGERVTIRDDGRGIPLGVHKKSGISTLTTVLTNLQAGGKFGTVDKDGNEAYAVSSGLHGVGLKAVNFLSAELKATVWHKGKAFNQSFKQGLPVTPEPVPCPERDGEIKHGTEISWIPDTEIFKTSKLDVKRVPKMFGDIVYLCPGLTIELTINGAPMETFKADGGLGLMIAENSVKHTSMGPAFVATNPEGNISVALHWVATDTESWWSYCNISPTPEHGTHVTGIKRAISKAIGEHTTESLNSNDFRAGLFAAVHAKVGTPIFKGQTKTQLKNREVEVDILDWLGPALQTWFTQNKTLTRQIIARAVAFRKAREQHRKLKASINNNVTVKKNARGVLPGKLVEAAGCDPDKRELFVVEGDSAGGTAVKGRDPAYQEILPLRGKIRNASRTNMHTLFKNAEIQAIVTSIGVNVDLATGDCDTSNLRVGKVMLLMDADPDGQHISALALAFIVNYAWKLIEEGRVYIVQSPLFRGVNSNGSKHWFGDSVKDIEQQAGVKKDKLQISRLKGHGESDHADLRYYAMDPTTRKLTNLTYSEDQKTLFAGLMGSDASVRKAILGIDLAME